MKVAFNHLRHVNVENDRNIYVKVLTKPYHWNSYEAATLN